MPLHRSGTFGCAPTERGKHDLPGAINIWLLRSHAIAATPRGSPDQKSGGYLAVLAAPTTQAKPCTLNRNLFFKNRTHPFEVVNRVNPYRGGAGSDRFDPDTMFQGPQLFE